MIDNYFFGQRVRQLRQSVGLSLQDVANFIGTQKSSLGNIERGDKSPSIDMILNLANYFFVSIDYLLGRNDDPQHDFYFLQAEKTLLEDMPKPFIDLFQYAKSKGLKNEIITTVENWNLIRWFEEWKENTQICDDYYARRAEYEKSEDEKHMQKQMKNTSLLRPTLPRVPGLVDEIKRHLQIKKPNLDWYASKTSEDRERDRILAQNLQRIINVNTEISGNLNFTPIPNHLSNYLYELTMADIKNLDEEYKKK